MYLILAAAFIGGLVAMLRKKPGAQDNAAGQYLGAHPILTDADALRIGRAHLYRAQHVEYVEGVDAMLILAVIARESRGNSRAVNPSEQAYGLMQVRGPAFQDYANAHRTTTFRHADLIVNDDAAVIVGGWYLRTKIREMGGDIREGLRAYNAGAGRAKKNPDIGAEYASWVLDSALPILKRVAAE